MLMWHWRCRVKKNIVVMYNVIKLKIWECFSRAPLSNTFAETGVQNQRLCRNAIRTHTLEQSHDFLFIRAWENVFICEAPSFTFRSWRLIYIRFSNTFFVSPKILKLTGYHKSLCSVLLAAILLATASVNMTFAFYWNEFQTKHRRIWQVGESCKFFPSTSGTWQTSPSITFRS